MVTAVRGSDVGPTALTRTATVVAPADAVQMASTRAARRILSMEPPLSTRAYGPVGRRRSPGSRAYRFRAFPAASCGVQWLRACARAVGVPGHSGGSAPDSHRLPSPPTLNEGQSISSVGPDDGEPDPHLHQARRP